MVVDGWRSGSGKLLENMLEVGVPKGSGEEGIVRLLMS